MSGYNKEELINRLEGMMDELEQLEKLLESKKRSDIFMHEQNVIKLESDFFRFEKSIIPATDTELSVIGRSPALKLEIG